MYGGSGDAFVAKFAPDGRVIYSTYLGGTYREEGEAIAVDAAGNAYVTGLTGSDNFPAALASQNLGACLGHDYCTDAYVAKLTPDGSMIAASIYLGGSSFLGGSGFDEGTGIKVAQASGRVYVGGTTNSADFPISVRVAGGATKGCSTNECDPGFSGFISVLDQSTLAQIASTLVPTTEGAMFRATIDLDIDADGTAYQLEQVGLGVIGEEPYFHATAWNPSDPVVCRTAFIRGVSSAIAVETSSRILYSASTVPHYAECGRGCAQTIGANEHMSAQSWVGTWLSDPDVQCDVAQ
jgi:hypothetical protein